MARWGIALLVVGVLAAPCRADQATDDARARQLSDEGVAHFRQARYRQAIEAFNASLALRPLPILLFDLAQAHRLAGDCEPAFGFYRRYIEEKPDAPNRALVEKFMAELEPCAHPRPAPAAIPIALTAPAPAPAPAPRRPFFKRWWFWTSVAGAVAIAGGIGLGVGLTRGGGHPPTPTIGPVEWMP